MCIIHPALSLFHHLIYPIPFPKAPLVSLSQANQPHTNSGPEPEPDPMDGLNLAHRLHAANMQKEFNGLAHIFVSCLGVMAYASPDLDPAVEKEKERWGGGDIMSVQCELSMRRAIRLRCVDLAQDLLESVVEGPEGDAIFEIYEEVEEPGRAGAGASAGAGLGELSEGEQEEWDLRGEDEQDDGMVG